LENSKLSFKLQNLLSVDAIPDQVARTAIINVLNNCPDLLKTYNELANGVSSSTGVSLLTKIEYNADLKDTSGSYDPNTGTLHFGLGQVSTGSIYPDIDQVKLASLMGHEGEHATNVYSLSVADQQFYQKISSISSSTGTQAHDYTAALADYQKAHITDESQAGIAGWNAQVAYKESVLGRPLSKLELIDLARDQYAFYDLDGNIKSGFTANPEHRGEILASDPSNIANNATQYGQYTPSVNNGTLLTYNEYYAANGINTICKTENGHPFQLDYDALKLNVNPAGGAFTTMEANDRLIKSGKVNNSSGTECTIANTADGSSILRFSDNKATVTMDSPANSGAISTHTTREYNLNDGKPSLATERTVTDDPSDGTRTTVTITCDASSQPCNIDIRTGLTANPEIITGEAVETIDDKGTKATVTGTGIDLTLNSADIALADGAVASIHGSGNKVTVGSDNWLDIDGSSNTINILGTYSTVNDAGGDEQINIAGDYSSAKLMGDGCTVTCSGKMGYVSFEGDRNTAIAGGAFDSLTSWGSDNTFSMQGNYGSLMDYGTGSTMEDTGIGNYTNGKLASMLEPDSNSSLYTDNSLANSSSSYTDNSWTDTSSSYTDISWNDISSSYTGNSWNGITSWITDIAWPDTSSSYTGNSWNDITSWITDITWPDTSSWLTGNSWTDTSFSYTDISWLGTSSSYTDSYWPDTSSWYTDISWPDTSSWYTDISWPDTSSWYTDNSWTNSGSWYNNDYSSSFSSYDFGYADFGYFGFAGDPATVEAALNNGDRLFADDTAAFNDGADDAQQARQELQGIIASGFHGEVLTGTKWDRPIITWSLAQPSGDPDADALFSGYMGSNEEAEIQQAFDAWSADSGLTFREVNHGADADADIRIGWGSFDTARTGVVGYTSVESDANGTTRGAVIRLEDTAQTPMEPADDGVLVYAGTDATFLQAMQHEIGHTLGLADNTDINSIESYYLSRNNRALNGNDIAAIRTLYGTAANDAATTNVHQLIQAMASFAPPSAGQINATSLNDIYPQSPLLAAAH
jgi:hypothetical protein